MELQHNGGGRQDYMIETAGQMIKNHELLGGIENATSHTKPTSNPRRSAQFHAEQGEGMTDKPNNQPPGGTMAARGQDA